MVTTQFAAVRRVFDRVRQGAANDRGDGELLTRFLTTRDDTAFGVLIRRHGPMVFGVCRRVLRDTHAAEDAFQATFLVLARKAGAVRPPAVLGAWLYGVAYRTALKARGQKFRRQQVEREYAEQALQAAHASRPAGDAADLRAVIDEQLNALPEKYRLPLVLCAVQGLGKAEAAGRLGLPEGTVSSRLARAREMLRDRLARRGVVVPAALGGLFLPGSLRAAVPLELSAAATQTAAGVVPVAPHVLTLTREVLYAMALTKWKLLSSVAVAVALTGSGFGLYVSADEKKPGDKPAVVKPGEKPAKPVKPTPDGAKPAADKPKPGADNAAKKPNRMLGRILKVDAKAGTITILWKGNGGVHEDVVPVAADAAVTIDGKPAKLADLKPELNVEAVVPGEGKPASEIKVSGQRINGTVISADATTLTVSSKPAERVVKLAAGGKVLVGGKEAKLGDLKAGERVVVTMTADDAGAVLVTVIGKDDGGKPKPVKPGDKPGGDKPKGDKPKGGTEQK